MGNLSKFLKDKTFLQNIVLKDFNKDLYSKVILSGTSVIVFPYSTTSTVVPSCIRFNSSNSNSRQIQTKTKAKTQAEEPARARSAS